MKKYRPLTDVYSSIYGNPVPKPPRQTINENVTIDFDFGGGRDASYSVEDEYAKRIHTRIKFESRKETAGYVKQIFANGDWGKGSKKAEKEFTELLIDANVSNELELLKYLAEQKDRLLDFSQIGVTRIVDFVDLIVNILPDKFNENGNNLANFIKNVHLNIRPGASTSVGLGEATFAIFGTAKKGRSGDLQWSGSEVEIKTNGTSGSGAVLGGDGHINKVSERIARSSTYTDLGTERINRTLKSIETIKDLYISHLNNGGDENDPDLEKQYDKIKDNFRKIGSRGKKGLSKLYKTAIATSLNAAFNTPITKDFRPTNRNTNNRLINSIISDLNAKKNITVNAATNLPSQIAALFSESGDDLNTYVNIFSDLKTYNTSFQNGKEQLKNFFSSRDFSEFNPKENYELFERLIGAIAIIGYQEHIKFDYLTAGNDENFTMVALDCKDPNLEKIFSQLEAVPEIKFDLNIDVFEGGKFRSQTVFAKSPRIILT